MSEADSEPEAGFNRLGLISIYTSAVSLAVFSVSLVFPAFAYESNGRIENFPAIACLLWMPIALFAYPSAWGNPLLFFSWAMALRGFTSQQQKWRVVALVSAVLASCLGLSFLNEKTVLLSTAGNTAPIISSGLGFWLWIIAMLIQITGLVLDLVCGWDRYA
ncbi:MAG: hypothetical protein AAGI68_14925 [Planctomycetota bacterium]